MKPAWTFDDGGRSEAGYKGLTSDCGARAIAIAAEMPYQEAYDLINEFAQRERPHARKRRSSARTGVHRATMRWIMEYLGWTWTPTMAIGSGTTVHLRGGELPPGRLIVACSKHYVAVIDSIVHDTHDPTRDGTRAVYGYWQEPAAPRKE